MWQVLLASSAGILLGLWLLSLGSHSDPVVWLGYAFAVASVAISGVLAVRVRKERLA